MRARVYRTEAQPRPGERPWPIAGQAKTSLLLAGLFAAPAFVERRLAGRRTVAVQELCDVPAIFSAEAATWRLRRGADAVMVVNDPRVALALAADGLGVTAAPEEMAVRHGQAQVPLAIPGHTLSPRELFLVYLAKERPSRVRVVVKHLLRVAPVA